MDKKLSRRDFMRRAMALGAAAVVAPSLWSACSPGGGGGGGGGELSCANPPGLQPAQADMRRSLNYVDRTANASQRCDNCQLYIQPTSEGACGGCQLPLGPVHPAGWCSSWAPMAG